MTDDTHMVPGEILLFVARKVYRWVAIVAVVIGLALIFIGGIFLGRELSRYQEPPVLLERGPRIVVFHERGYQHFGQAG